MFETKLIKCFPCQVHSSYLSLNFLIFFYSFVTFAIFLFLCLACYYNQRTIPYFSWYFRSLARSFPVLLFSEGGVGIFGFGHFYVGFSVLLSVAVSGFSVF